MYYGVPTHSGHEATAAARNVLRQNAHRVCVVAAADSLISARALLTLSQGRRLLTEDNSDGIIPGEAAACLVLGADRQDSLATIRGLGFAVEEGLPSNDVPLRANGIAAAARAALAEAGLNMHDIDFRVSDAAGESYYFKEQSLMVSKLLRRRKETFPLWQSADSLGDPGVAAGLCVVQAVAAMEAGRAPGPRALTFASGDNGLRAAMLLEAGSSNR